MLTPDDVSEHNLYAKYHADGNVEVKRFPRCRYRDADDMPPWYPALKVVWECGLGVCAVGNPARIPIGAYV